MVGIGLKGLMIFKTLYFPTYVFHVQMVFLATKFAASLTKPYYRM